MWILVIVILLIVIGGVYIYSNKTATTATTTTVASTATSTLGLTMPGMQEYTDAGFGFSFWYPNGWQVTTVVNPPFGAQIQNGTIVRKLSVGNASDTWAIVIEEVNSPTMTITDTGGAGPFGPVTYYFDTSSKTWMKVTGDGVADVPFATTTANVSVNTIGGLPMFSGTSRFDTTIIPVSTSASSGNFLVISDGGTVNATTLAKTVTAVDTTSTPPNPLAITSISPSPAHPGDTVHVYGRGFVTVPQKNGGNSDNDSVSISSVTPSGQETYVSTVYTGQPIDDGDVIFTLPKSIAAGVYDVYVMVPVNIPCKPNAGGATCMSIISAESANIKLDVIE